MLINYLPLMGGAIIRDQGPGCHEGIARAPDRQAIQENNAPISILLWVSCQGAARA